MQHANLAHIAMVGDVAGKAPHEDFIEAVGSPSSRKEMAIRELAKLQAQAARLATIIEADDEDVDEGRPASKRRSDTFVRGILQARLQRGSCFRADLFSDPAWDMLLELYAAELGQVRVSVTSLCIASNSPTSTALRWISALEREGLIERQPDPLDGRRSFLSLTRDGICRFDRYFEAIGNKATL